MSSQTLTNWLTVTIGLHVRGKAEDAVTVVTDGGPSVCGSLGDDKFFGPNNLRSIQVFLHLSDDSTVFDVFENECFVHYTRLPELL